MRQRKCKFISPYVLDPEVGWMHARIQTWLPFNVQIDVNGRGWLSRQMDRAGMAYRREENGFPWIEDLPRAQDLMKQQLRTRWPEFLGRVARRLHPDHAKILPEVPEYYGSTYQSEWASDGMFRDRQSVDARQAKCVKWRDSPKRVYHPFVGRPGKGDAEIGGIRRSGQKNLLISTVSESPFWDSAGFASKRSIRASCGTGSRPSRAGT